MYTLKYDEEHEKLVWNHKLDKSVFHELMEDINHDLDAEILNRLNAHKLTDFDSSLIPVSIWNELHPPQQQGVEFIVRQGGRAIIADHMGTGKTRLAIVSTLFYPDCYPILVVCPSSLCKNWAKEWAHVNNDKVQVIHSSKQKISPDAKVVVISYGCMISSLFAVALTGTYWGFIIFDECHNIKSITAKRTKYAIAISKNAEHVLLMSGTPMNRPKDMYTLAKCARPNLFTRFYNEYDKTKFYFSNRYCGPTKRKICRHLPPQTFHDGATRTDELHAILRHTMLICRAKEDIMDLPEKVRESVVIGANTKQWITKNKAYLNAVREENKRLYEGRFMQMVMDTSKKKTPASIQYFQNVLLPRLIEDPTLKVIVFGYYINNMTLLKQFFDSTPYENIYIDGRTPPKYRQALVDKFQDDPKCRIAVLSIKACGSGITLTAASQVYITDLMYNPEDCLQAEDRAHRFTQKRVVTVTYLMLDNSTDKMLFDMIDRKYNVCSRVIENKNKRLKIS